MDQYFVMEQHVQIISDLLLNLEKVETSSDQVIRQVELSINHCKKALVQIRELVILEGFPDQASEIYFFKTLKPQVNSKLFFLISVFDIQTRRPSWNMECQVKALKREQKLANLFLLKNQEVYQYYRSGSVQLDHQYFLRGTCDILQLAKNPLIFEDPMFSTSHDYLFSKVIANEMLMEFVEKEIQKLHCNKLNKYDKSIQVPDIEAVWTDHKNALIELLYAVDSLGSINKGNIDIKRLVKLFGRTLNIDLGDVYHAFGEMKMRKKERTKSGPANSVSPSAKITLNPYDQVAEFRGVIFNFSFQASLQWMEERGKILLGSHFAIAPTDLELIYKLLVYAIGDQDNAARFGISLKKGILLTGPIGCGKTSLMQLVGYFFPRETQFLVKPTREISFEYEKDGFTVINHYSKGSFVKYANMPFLPKVYCFDDLGLEQTPKYYGNECNVMAEILLNRYDMFVSKRMMTHITTNLSASELESIYGNRIRSRMREMFNLVAFDRETKDKRV